MLQQQVTIVSPKREEESSSSIRETTMASDDSVPSSNDHVTPGSTPLDHHALTTTITDTTSNSLTTTLTSSNNNFQEDNQLSIPNITTLQATTDCIHEKTIGKEQETIIDNNTSAIQQESKSSNDNNNIPTFESTSSAASSAPPAQHSHHQPTTSLDSSSLQTQSNKLLKQAESLHSGEEDQITPTIRTTLRPQPQPHTSCTHNNNQNIQKHENSSTASSILLEASASIHHHSTSTMSPVKTPTSEEKHALSGKVFRHLANYLNHVHNKKESILEREAQMNNHRAHNPTTPHPSNGVLFHHPSHSSATNSNSSTLLSASSEMNHRTLSPKPLSEFTNNHSFSTPATTTTIITSSTTQQQTSSSSTTSLKSLTSSSTLQSTTTSTTMNHHHFIPTSLNSGNNVAIINGRRVVLNFQTSTPLKSTQSFLMHPTTSTTTTPNKQQAVSNPNSSRDTTSSMADLGISRHNSSSANISPSNKISQPSPFSSISQSSLHPEISSHSQQTITTPSSIALSSLNPNTSGVNNEDYHVNTFTTASSTINNNANSSSPKTTNIPTPNVFQNTDLDNSPSKENNSSLLLENTSTSPSSPSQKPSSSPTQQLSSLFNLIANSSKALKEANVTINSPTNATQISTSSLLNKYRHNRSKSNGQNHIHGKDQKNAGDLSTNTHNSSPKRQLFHLDFNNKSNVDDNTDFTHDMLSVRSITSVTSYADQDTITPRADNINYGAFGGIVGIGSSITQHVNEHVGNKTPRRKLTQPNNPLTPRSQSKTTQKPKFRSGRRSNSLAAYAVDSNNYFFSHENNNSELLKLTDTAASASSSSGSEPSLFLDVKASSMHRSASSEIPTTLQTSPVTPTKSHIGRLASSPAGAISSAMARGEVAASALDRDFRDGRTSAASAKKRDSFGVVIPSSPLKQVVSSLSFYLPKLTPLDEVAKNSNIIIHAVKKGCIALLECVLNDIIVNSVRDNHNGNSLLQIAIQHNQVEVVAFLLSKYDVNLNHTNKIEGTALHIASTKGNCDVLTLLLTAVTKTGSKKMDWGKKDIYGNAGIHLACEMHDLKAVETQILLGVAPILKKRDSGVTALHIAATKGYYDIVKLLIHFYSEPITFANMRDDNGLTALMRSVLSIHCNDTMETEEFFERYHPAYYPNSALGSFEKFVRTHSRNWNKDLTQNERENYLKIWTFLLNEIDYSACCTTKTKAHGLNLFHLAAIANNAVFLSLCAISLPEEIYQKLFLEHDKYEGFTPLHVACWYNNIEVVQVFLSIATENVKDIQKRKSIRERRRYTDFDSYHREHPSDSMADLPITKKKSDSELFSMNFPSNSSIVQNMVGSSDASLVADSFNDSHTHLTGHHIHIPELRLHVTSASGSQSAPTPSTPGTARIRKGLEKLSNLIKTPRLRSPNSNEGSSSRSNQAPRTPVDDSGASNSSGVENQKSSAKSGSRFFKRSRGTSKKATRIRLEESHEQETLPVVFNDRKNMDPHNFRYSIDTPNSYGETALFVALERFKLILLEEQEIRNPLLQKMILENKRKHQNELKREYQGTTLSHNEPIATSANSPLGISAHSIYSSPSSSDKSTRFSSFRRLSSVHTGSFNMDKYWEALYSRLTSIDNIVHMLIVAKSCMKTRSTRHKDVTMPLMIHHIVDEVEKLPDEGTKLSDIHNHISIKYTLLLKHYTNKQ
ncbi:hypothetical protein C9374_006845 [Naegleria lovaniensis]|uniref:Uncharacterized protein n=1 Tax=Naegleria lovaniensis TaxID=51637 RepID=A0AA88GZ92_NAELO|nr:uncharacterized protein C9374_006845 [Naegleria lovaniensis]KAG2393314.1 hypothetical protein C9374_006845 [Naegleria lovaniensis]